MWLPALLLQASDLYISAKVLGAMAAVGDPATDPVVVFAVMGSSLKWTGLSLLAAAVFYPMLITGSLKQIVRGERQRLPFYLQFGGDELRVLFSTILIYIMFLIAYLACVAALLVGAFILSSISPDLAGAASVIAIVVLVCAAIWFSLRISLAYPAAIGTRTVGIAQSWTLTQGKVWSLFFYWLIWIAILVIVSFAFTLVMAPSYLEMMAAMMEAGSDPAATEEMNRMFEWELARFDMSKPTFWIAAGATYVYTLVTTGMANVASGVAYRFLSKD
jgi:hypothetical protein